ncbi:MAG: hypothetical protein QXK37_01255 [Candidatus Woesearchaeota archaeon]
MKKKKLNIIAWSLLFIITLLITNAQESNLEENTKAEYNGLIFGTAQQEIVTNPSGDIVLSGGVQVEVLPTFSGTLIGGFGGCIIKAEGTTLILIERSVVKIKNGKITEIINADVNEEAVLAGHKVIGKSISLISDTIRCGVSCTIDGVHIKNLNPEQPLKISFSEQGFLLEPASVSTTAEINGARIRLHYGSSISINDGKIAGFKLVDILDSVNINGFDIKGNKLSYSKGEISFYRISINRLNFQSGYSIEENVKNVITLYGNGEFAIKNANMIYQTNREGEVIRLYEAGDYLFSGDSEVEFTAQNANFSVYNIADSVIRVTGVTESTKFFIGESPEKNSCGQEKNCVEFTSAQTLYSSLEKKNKIEISGYSDSFPFRLVDSRISEDAEFSVGSQKFLFTQRNMQESISDTVLPKDLNAIIIRDENGGRVIDSTSYTGVYEEMNGEKIASFSAEVMSKVLREHEERLGFSIDKFLVAQENIDSLQKQGVEKEIIDFVLELYRNPVYLLSKDDISFLGTYLNRINKEHSFAYDVVREYILREREYNANIIDELINLYKEMPNSRFSRELITQMKPREFLSLDALKDLVDFSKEEDVTKISDLYFETGGIRAMSDLAYLAKTHEVGVHSSDDFFHFIYTIIDSGYDKPPDLAYPPEKMRDMYRFYLYTAKDMERLAVRKEGDLAPVTTFLALELYMKPLEKGDENTLNALNEFSNGQVEFDSMLFKSKPSFKVLPTGLLEYKGEPIEYKNLDPLKRVVSYMDSVALDESVSIEERETLSDYLMYKSQSLYLYLNGLHNNKNLREEFVKKIPPELLFYMIASSENNFGTISYPSGPPQVYPSSEEVVLNYYKSKVNPLQDALKYEGLPAYSNFVYTLSDRKQIDGLLIEASPEVQRHYTEFLLEEVTNPKESEEDYYSRTKVATLTIGRILKNDKQETAETREMLKDEIISALTSDDSNLYLQYLVLDNKNIFSEEELDLLGYDKEKEDFPSFAQNVKDAFASKNIDIKRLIRKENDGSYILPSAIFFGSLHEKQEQYHYDNLIKTLKEDGFKEVYLKDVEEYSGKKISYVQFEKIVPVTYEDSDGGHILNVKIKVNLYPRIASESDEVPTIVSTRGHVGTSAATLESFQDKTAPELVIFGGCYEYRDAFKFFSEYSNMQMAYATTGTGRGEINNYILTGVFEAIQKGITDREKMAQFIDSYVQTKIKMRSDLRLAFESYSQVPQLAKIRYSEE